MIDKFTIGVLLLAFILSISITVYEAGRIEALEEKIAVLSAQTEELAEKEWQIYKTYMNAIVGDKITEETKKYLELGFKAGYLEGFKKSEGE